MPGYDSQGKLWTVQYIKADGAKRFAKGSRKHGCFHVVGAPNSAAALQKIAVSPVVVIAEGYATAATIAEQPNACMLAAFDSGNLFIACTQSTGRIGKATVAEGLIGWLRYAGVAFVAVDADSQHRTLSHR